MAIRKTLLAASALAVLLAFGTEAANAEGLGHPDAPRGDSFMRGLKNPHELANLIRASLKVDPSGKSLLDPVKCHQAFMHSCANAWDYLVGFQSPTGDPDAHLTSVNQLPDYLDSLVEVTPEDEEYWMWCLVPLGSDAFNPTGECVSRKFGPGEKAWANPVTHKIVLAQDCTNPVGQINKELVVEPTPCDRVEYDTDAGDSVFVGILGTESLPITKCMALQEAGDTVPRKVLPQDCPERVGTTVCNFDADIAPVTANLQADKGTVSVQVQASYVSMVTGRNVFWVPSIVANSGAKYEVVICRRHADGSQLNAAGVRNVHFRDGVAIVPLSFWTLYVPGQ